MRESGTMHGENISSICVPHTDFLCSVLEGKVVIFCGEKGKKLKVEKGRRRWMIDVLGSQAKVKLGIEDCLQEIV